MTESSHHVTVVLEYNTRTPDNYASVWVCGGAYDDDDDLSPSYNNSPGAERIAGPMALDEAVRISIALVRSLSACGLSVQRLEAADD